MVAVVRADEVEEAADLLGRVRDAQGHLRKVVFVAEGDDVRGRRAEGFDGFHRGAEELVAVPDGAEHLREVGRAARTGQAGDGLREVARHLGEVGFGGGGAGLGGRALGEFFEEGQLALEIGGEFVLGEEVFAEVDGGFEEGVVAALTFRDEDGAVLTESGATLGPPGLEGGRAILAGGEGSEVDALEVGFEGVGGAFPRGELGEEGFHQTGGVIGDEGCHLGLAFIGVGLGDQGVGVDDVDLAGEERGIDGMAFLGLFGEVDGEAVGRGVEGTDDADAPSLMEAESGLSFGYLGLGILQSVDFSTLWVGGLVAHCKKWFWG